MRILASLAVRDFRLLWLGTSFGHVGYWAYLVAVGWLAWEMSGSGTFVGVVSAVGGLPGLALMLPGGVAADRYGRRGMVIWSNAVTFVAMAALAVLFTSGSLSEGMLLLLVLLISSASTLNLPARQALGPQLAGPGLLANAVALNAIGFNASRVIGPAVAGGLMWATGIGGAFYFIAACLAVATGLTMLVGPEPPRAASARRRSVVENFLDGVRYVAHEPVVRGCIIIAIIQNLFSLTYSQLMPLFAAQVFAVGGSGMGALLSAAGIGSLVGALGSAVLSVFPHKGRVVFTTGVLLGALLVGFALVSWFPLALVILVAVGCTQALSLITTQMVLNLATPDELRGRAMAVYMMTWSIAPLSALPAGWAADQIGAPLTLTICGALLVAGLLVAAALVPHVRDFEDGQYTEGNRDSAPGRTESSGRRSGVRPNPA